jgi:hypothetical protein
LDQEIEQLEKIVENCLNRCNAMWDGSRCTLAANHEPTNSHKFPIEFLLTPSLQGLGGHWHGTRVGNDPNELSCPENDRRLSLSRDAPTLPLAGLRYP